MEEAEHMENMGYREEWEEEEDLMRYSATRDDDDDENIELSPSYEEYSFNEDLKLDCSPSDLASRHKVILAETEASIDRFIKESHLLIHYNPLKLETNKKQVLDWLREKYTKDGQLYTIDCGGQARMLRHLLLHPTCDATTMLYCCTHHDWLRLEKEWPKSLTRVLRMTCEEVPLNAPVLKRHLKVDENIFTNEAEYRDLLYRYSQCHSVMVDVCSVWFGDIIKCLHVLEKNDYPSIEEVIMNRKMLSTEMKQVHREERLRTTVLQKNNSIRKVVDSMVNTYLDNLSTIIEYEVPYVANDVTDLFIVKRAVSITELEGGIQASLETINACIKRVGSYANDAINQRGVDSFRGNITLEIDEMPISSFDKAKKMAWHPRVQALMNSVIEKRLVEDHREQKMDINTLVVKFGKEEIARTIIPSTTRPHHYIVNHGVMIINNNHNTTNINIGRDEDENEHIPTNKRKRTIKESPHIEKIKRIRLVNEIEENSGLDIYRLVIKRLDQTPDYSQSRQCIVCCIVKPFSSFLVFVNSVHKEQNICHGCMTTRAKWRKQNK